MRTLAEHRTEALALNRSDGLRVYKEYVSGIFIFLALYICFSYPVNAETPPLDQEQSTCEYEVCENNLLTAGSFEVCKTGWTFGSTTGFNYDTYYAMNGYYNIFIAPYYSSDTYAELSQTVSASPGEKYSLSFYAGVHDPVHDQYVYLQFLDSKGDVLEESSVEITYDVTGSYSLGSYNLAGTAPSGTENVRVLGSVTKATGYNYAYLKLDGVCLTKTEKECVELPSTDGCISTSELYTFDFDSDEEGFTYQDDVFYGTTQPAYASGQQISSGGYNGGALQVDLGGIDKNEIQNMSGAWEYTFFLSQATEIQVAFQYKMNAADWYESDEYSDVLLMVDNTFYGSNGNDYITRISGGGTVDWTYYSVSLGTLSAGNHSLKIGGFNNGKNGTGESTTITFDEVEISQVTSTSDFSWANSISWNGGSIQSTYRLKGNGVLSAELDLPSGFHVGPITVDITDFYTWDGYENRQNVTAQPNEQLRLDFYKDGNLVHQTGYTPDLADGVCFAEWRGSLGTFNAINGVDQVVIVHPELDDSSLPTANSIVPVSLCISYEINNSLPVSWLAFEAQWLGKNASLTWSTASEENASHFEIQRSIDGVQFETVGSIPATGNTQDISTYTFIDKAALSAFPISYYRLEQVDLDGKGAYSNIIGLKTSNRLAVTHSVDVYPNPASSRVNLSLRQGTSIQEVSLLNSLGQKVAIEAYLNGTDASLNLENIIPGHYYVRIHTLNNQFMEPLFISK